MDGHVCALRRSPQPSMNLKPVGQWVSQITNVLIRFDVEGDQGIIEDM